MYKASDSNRISGVMSVHMTSSPHLNPTKDLVQTSRFFCKRRTFSLSRYFAEHLRGTCDDDVKVRVRWEFDWFRGLWEKKRMC